MASLNQHFAFSKDKKAIRRTIAAYGRKFRKSVRNRSALKSPSSAYFHSMLNGPSSRRRRSPFGTVRYIDLFCGGGGLSLGVDNALDLMGMNGELVLAADIDSAGLGLVRKRFRALSFRKNDIDEMLKYAVDYSHELDDFLEQPRITDHEIASCEGHIDLIVGGPPCQGHSNLNNHTRRSDPRNTLYFLMPAFAVALKAPNLLIENVPAVRHASVNVVGITKTILETHGYHVEDFVLDASKFGVAQTRKRHFLLASKNPIGHARAVISEMEVPEISFDDINRKLPDADLADTLFEKNGRLSEENIRRIRYLFESKSWNLPSEHRPECHRKEHTYPAMYGRMHEDRPAPTITTGFGSPGRGRFVHPNERRTITAREAARLQAFPDWYWRTDPARTLNRTQIANIIGNAVPCNLVEPLIFSLFDSLSRNVGPSDSRIAREYMNDSNNPDN